MAIEQAIYSILKNNKPVAAIISTRIFPNLIPQGQNLPAVVYQRISGSGDRDTNGALNLYWPTFQFTCSADTFATMVILANAVKTALEGFTGTKASVTLSNIELIDEGDMPNLSDVKNVFMRRLDFKFWFKT